MSDLKNRHTTDRSSWTAFLVISFVVLGLCGVFSCYAAQLPLQRALAHEAALDHLLQLPSPPSPLQMTALHDELGNEADTLVKAPDRAATALHLREESRARFLDEAADIRRRLIIVTAVVCGASALFGAMVLSVAQRRKL